MKTIREIADEIGIDKQRVYRHIKNQGMTAHQKQGVMYFDDVAEVRIKQYFLQGHTSNEAHHKASPDVTNDTAIFELKEQIADCKQMINDFMTIMKMQEANAKNKSAKIVHHRKKLSKPKPRSPAINRLMESVRASTQG